MERIIRVAVDTIPRVHTFVQCNDKFDGDVDVISGRYVVDGKSILGMFSLDLRFPLKVRLIGDDDSVSKLLADYDSQSLSYTKERWV